MTPQIINCLISIVLLSFATGVLIKKRKEQPDLRLLGLPINTLIIVNYVGIALFVALLIAAVMGGSR